MGYGTYAPVAPTCARPVVIERGDRAATMPLPRMADLCSHWPVRISSMCQLVQRPPGAHVVDEHLECLFLATWHLDRRHEWFEHLSSPFAVTRLLPGGRFRHCTRRAHLTRIPAGS